ncbi:ribosome biogenesis GTPase YqeH [Marinilactibacillus sp. 15R]|uniref:ribosome biogenesis GTPase YqeH n=1 Tax=Marinilactibacillus sp. 15R TaxID=1911586 RepID=UPI00090C5D42|nr:ribosome biogenesis GTPase YqeH [Marinilactibacillus sp. 15R]API89134.1 ribosome biogenesis GTPase YqeH [Marinilactibacillus sp. 15R]
MSQLKDESELICIGCGATLQSSDDTKAGFLPFSVLKNADESEDLYCKRCFRLRHYNEVQDVELTDDDFLNMLHEISNKQALVVNIVDIFDFNGSFISSIQRFAGKNPVILVGNKIDLLPKSLKEGKMRQWLTERAHEARVHPKEVFLTSAMRSDSVEALMNLIEKERKGQDVYVVGTTNVGKSTLINQIIKLATNAEDIITTSYFPGTTLGKIEIPLDDERVLVDTPGIIQSSQIAHYLTPKELKQVTPRKEIKPKVYQLNVEQTLFLGGLARFDYIRGNGKQSFVCYLSNELNIHRTKLEKADELYAKQRGELLTPPYKDNLETFPELKRFEFNVKEPSDLVFSGLGWISIEDAGTTVAGWAPRGADISLRKSLI